MHFNRRSKEAILAREEKRRNLILNGNLFKVIIIITLPLFFYSLLNYVYGIVDMVMCGEISKEAVSAVATLDQIKNMITAIGGGLAAGGSILIAREIGKNDFVKARRLTTTVFILTFTIAVITVGVIIPLAPLLLRLIRIDEALISIGLSYFQVSIATAALMMINTVFMGVEKAKGTTMMITILNFGVIIIKVCLSSIFIYGLDIKDMFYVSLSTFIANALLTIFILIRIARRNYIFHFSFKEKELNKPTVGRIVKVSFPIFLGKFIFSLGKVVINSMAQRYGSDTVGALGVSNQMGGSITNGLNSFEESSSSIISQNLGNNNVKRALTTFFYSLILSLGIAVIGVILVTIFNDQLINIYSKGNEEFFEMIDTVFSYEKIGIIFLAINASVMGLLYGFGLTKLSMIINLSRVFVFRIPILFIIQNCFQDQVTGLAAVGLSMGISNACIGIVAIIVGTVVVILIKKNKLKYLK